MTENLQFPMEFNLGCYTQVNQLH